jgi:peptidoglycan/LPS O-acetylase OafA/YrhL
MSTAALGTQLNAKGSGKIPSLDGVRAISFLIVFVAHAGLDHIVPGRFGVAVFFLLSGYLITTLMIREREKTGWISLKLFYMRRALRIFPPMYAIFGATVLFLWSTHQLVGVTRGGICSQLFYYQNYYFHGGIIPGLGPLWSLAVEEHFYIFFPPLMLLLLARLKNYRQIAWSLLAICGLIFVWRCCVVAFMPHGMQWARDASDTRADSILFGCLLACLQQTSACERIFERKRLERYIVPGCLSVLLVTFAVRNPIFRETLRYTLQALAIGPLLYYVIRYPETRIGKLLNTSVLSYLGLLSYSLYLIHASVLLQMQREIHGKIAAGLLGLLISIALAFITRIVIEKPTDKLRARLRHQDAARLYVGHEERELSAT